MPSFASSIANAQCWNLSRFRRCARAVQNASEHIGISGLCYQCAMPCPTLLRLRCVNAQIMLSMLDDTALSDVCLVVEGVEVAAHKAILGEREYLIFDH